MGKTYVSPEADIIKMENNLLRNIASRANTINAAGDSGHQTEAPEIGVEGETAPPSESKYNSFNLWE